MAFFDTQRTQGFEAVGPQVPGFAALQHMLPDLLAVVGGCINLVSQFTRKSQPDDAHPYAGQRSRQIGVQQAHMRNRFVAEIHAGEGGTHYVARFWAGHAHGSPLVRHRSHGDAQLRPHHLQQEFQMAHHLAGLRRGGGHEELGLAQAAGGAVVKHDAVFTQHETVTRLAYGQLGKTVHVDPVEELGRIRALHVDLAQGGHVGDTHLLAHDVHLGPVGLGQSCAMRVEPQRPHPQTRFHHDATVRQMPVVYGRAPHRLQMGTHAAPRQYPNGGRCVRWPEGGGAHIRHAQATPRRHHGQAIEVGGLALVGAHAQRGVAL